MTAASETSITFSISDASNSSLDMLGRVDASVTYSVSNSTWNIKMDAVSPERKTRKSNDVTMLYQVADQGSPHAYSTHLFQS